MGGGPYDNPSTPADGSCAVFDPRGGSQDFPANNNMGITGLAWFTSFSTGDGRPGVGNSNKSDVYLMGASNSADGNAQFELCAAFNELAQSGVTVTYPPAAPNWSRIHSISNYTGPASFSDIATGAAGPASGIQVWCAANGANFWFYFALLVR